LKYFWNRMSCSASFRCPAGLARPFEDGGRKLGDRELGPELAGREFAGFELAGRKLAAPELGGREGGLPETF
jgi:hypothetical protein